jgi:hypothetical protein
MDTEPYTLISTSLLRQENGRVVGASQGLAQG